MIQSCQSEFLIISLNLYVVMSLVPLFGGVRILLVGQCIFGDAQLFTGFPAGCQKESVPALLLALVNMILEGPSINDQSRYTTPAALSISQPLKFNTIKH